MRIVAMGFLVLMLAGCYGSVGPDGVRGGVAGVAEGSVTPYGVEGRAPGAYGRVDSSGAYGQAGAPGTSCNVSCGGQRYAVTCPAPRNASCQCDRPPYAYCR